MRIENGKKDIPVAAIIDNDRRKQGTTYKDISIVSPKDALGVYRKNAVILIASSVYEAMKRELENMGYMEMLYKLQKGRISHE